MRSVSTAVSFPAQLFAVTLLSVVAAFIFLAFSDASPTWLAVLYISIAASAAAALSRDVTRVLLYSLCFFAPFDIGKAILVANAKVSPGFSLYAPDVFLLPLLSLWLWDILAIRPRRIYLGAGFKIATMSLAWTWWTALFAPEIKDGCLMALTFTKFYLVYILLGDIIDDARMFRGVLMAFGWGIVANIFMAGAQFATKSQLALQGSKPTGTGVNLVFTETGAHAFRPGGFLHHPNALADYLCFVLPVLLAILFLGSRHVGVRAWWGAALLTLGGTAALLVTLSRGGWISFGVGALFFVAVGLKRGLVRHQQVVAIGLAGVLSVAAITAAYPNIYLRITGGDHRSAESRWAMIQQALLIWRGNFIDGVGLGYYNKAAQTNIPYAYARLDPGYQEKLLQGVVHNKYMLVAAEQGTVGVVFLALLLATFVWSFLKVRRWANPVYFALGLGLASGIVAQGSFYVFDHFYADVRIYLCWFAFGLLSALLKLNAREVTRSNHGRARPC